MLYITIISLIRWEFNDKLTIINVSKWINITAYDLGWKTNIFYTVTKCYKHTAQCFPSPFINPWNMPLIFVGIAHQRVFPVTPVHITLNSGWFVKVQVSPTSKFSQIYNCQTIVWSENNACNCGCTGDRCGHTNTSWTDCGQR